MLYVDNAIADPTKRDAATALQRLDLPQPESFVTFVDSLYKEYIRNALAIVAQSHWGLEVWLDNHNALNFN